jgi:hypothetical protein
MKKTVLNFITTACIIGGLFVFHSCETKPFEGVNAILTNVKIDHSIRLQVIDANPDALNPYPTNTKLTLSGAAIDQGVLYSDAGSVLTSTKGNAPIVNGGVTIAVKPFTIIDKNSPLKFTIKAEADYYLSNTKEVTITSVDSLQYINIELLKLTKLPIGIASKTATFTNIANGTLGSNFVVNVSTNDGTTAPPTNAVVATFPANTVLKDVNNNPITATGNLQATITNFSPNANSAASTTAIPGGTKALTQNNQEVNFIVTSAVDINLSLGNVAVKQFSNPVPFVFNLSNSIFNPNTGALIKAGDQFPIWSKNEDTMVWKEEGVTTIETNPTTGQLFSKVMVSHLSTWMIASGMLNCTNPLQLKYVSNNPNDITALIKVNAKGGTNQLITSKIVTVSDGSLINFTLPKGVDYSITMSAGATNAGTVISTIDLPSCSTTGTLNNTVTTSNPTLYFDLETKCLDGNFRYSGPIEYKLSSAKLWEPFTPSVLGKLTTTLLEWDKSYDFKIVYKTLEYKRTKVVSQSEFRQNGKVWEYWGKTDVRQTFFSAPNSCN